MLPKKQQRRHGYLLYFVYYLPAPGFIMVASFLTLKK